MKDYLMGLMAADGWIRGHTTKEGKTRLYPGIEIKDKEILEKIASEFDGKISSRTRGKTILYCLYIPTDFLPEANLLNTERKGILDFFQKLNEKEQANFIRGFFDGDGGVCIRYTKQYPYISVYFTIGSKKSELKKLLDYWLGKNNFNFSVYYDKRGAGAYNYNLSKKSEVERFYKIIYNNNPKFYLLRKYLIFVSYGFPRMETF